MHRGISPIVATVVLVAAAILIGSIAVVWVSGWVSQQAEKAKASGCALDVQYTVSDAEVNGTGGVRLKLTNTGSDTVRNFTVELELTNGSIFRAKPFTPAATVNLTTGQSDFIIMAPCNSNCANLDNLVKSVKVMNDVCTSFFATTERIGYKPFS